MREINRRCHFLWFITLPSPGDIFKEQEDRRACDQQRCKYIEVGRIFIETMDQIALQYQQTDTASHPGRDHGAGPAFG